MKIIVLASGSKGNATLIETAHSKILIDAGISYRQITNRLKTNSLSLDNLSGVLITHEHTDHTSGLGVLLGNINTKVYMTEKSHLGSGMNIFDMLRGREIEYLEYFKEITIEDLKITPLPLSHDSKDCIGFIIRENDKKLVYITDTGYVRNSVIELIKNADMYIIEANHDLTMLMNSNRTADLKKRVYGNEGHLSNEDAAACLCYSMGERTHQIVFAHISEECNEQSLIEQTVREVFNQFDYSYDKYEIDYAKQHEPSKVYEV